MQQAYVSAQQTFRYFWRELSWERRRIVPALEMAMIKLPFTDGPRSDGKPEFEQMWVELQEFDGKVLQGQLINSPNWLTSVKQGDPVAVPFSHLADWIMVADGMAYGAHTVNLMRSRMSAAERKSHDQAWGLDFGDANSTRLTLQDKRKPKQGFMSRLLGSRQETPQNELDSSVFSDHPMCVNMLPSLEAELQKDLTFLSSKDDRGWTMLHSDSLAGNLGVVRLLVRFGADIDAPTPDGRTAADLAQSIGWDEVAAYLANDARSEQGTSSSNMS